MTYEMLLSELKTLGKRKNNWYSVAKAISDAKETPEALPRPAIFMREAAESCGYSVNTLSRMIAVRDFYEKVKDLVSQLQGIDANSLSFPSLEIVKRLYQLDIADGIKMLAEVAAERITFRELRERYQEVVSVNTAIASAHQVAMLEVRDFKWTALRAAIAASEELFGGKQISAIKKSHKLKLPVDAVAYRHNYPFPYSAFEFVFLRDPENPKLGLENMLYRILFYSSFFNSFWVVFASTVGKERIDNFSNILSELERPSVGIAVLPWTEAARTSPNAEGLKVIRMSTGDPNPNYRSKIAMLEGLRDLMIRPYPQ